MILRIKFAVEERSQPAIRRCADYLEQLIKLKSNHPRVVATRAFTPYTLAPLLSATGAYEQSAIATIKSLRSLGLEPWELTFTDACIQATASHDWLKAMGLFETAVVNSQGQAAFLWWYTALLTSFGYVNEAIEILTKATTRFGSGSNAVRLDLGMLQIIGRRYSEAEETLLSLVETPTATSFIAITYLAILYEATDSSDKLASLESEFSKRYKKLNLFSIWNCYHPLLFGMWALIYGRVGNNKLAEKMYKRLLRSARWFGQSSPLELAIASMGCPEIVHVDATVGLLEKAAFSAHDPLTMWFHVFPPLRHLKDVPGFQSLLKRLNLPPLRPS